MDTHNGQGLSQVAVKEICSRLMCPDCRADVEYVQTAMRCTGCGRIFPIINEVVQMLPDSWLKDQGAPLDPPDNASSQDPDKEKSLRYEAERFGGRHGKKRNIWEQSIVNRSLDQHPEGIWILDVPCGMGRFNNLLARYQNNVVSLDKILWRAAYTLSRTCGLSTLGIHGDALSLPLRNDSVDVALCVRLTHHLNRESVGKLFRELARVAQEVLITFYNANTFRARYRKLKKVLRGKQPAYSYSLSSMSEIAAMVGLNIVDQFPHSGFFSRPIQFLWLKRKSSAG